MKKGMQIIDHINSKLKDKIENAIQKSNKVNKIITEFRYVHMRKTKHYLQIHLYDCRYPLDS